MIAIHKNNRYQHWTLYVLGKSVAGLTNFHGFWVGPLVVVVIDHRLYIVWRGRRLM